MRIDRRGFLAGGAAAATGVALRPRGGHAQAVPALSAGERGRMAEAATAFMRDYDVPGLGVAFARQGAILYDEAFGFAEVETRTALTPEHRFRVASVSKPVTAVAVMTLVEAGRLALADRPFAPSGLLRRFAPASPEGHLGDVPIEHLLTHMTGTWPNDASDPMFGERGLDHAALIARTLKTRIVREPPGGRFVYSNFGYCLLGRAIEAATQRPYAAYVQEAVLAPAGAAGMAIAGNTLAERQPPEVRYYGEGREDPYRLSVRRMDSHGGWIARPAAIARFASAVAGAPVALLKPATVAAMIAPPAGGDYAKGWRISKGGNWWHTGHLAGTTGLVVRTRAGLCWAALLNARHRHDGLSRDLDKLLWKMARTVKDWRA